MPREIRRFSKEFKLKVVQEHQEGSEVLALSRKYQIYNAILYRWIKEYDKNPGRAFSGKGKISTDEARVAELERIIGRLTIENELLKKVIRQQREIGN